MGEILLAAFGVVACIAAMGAMMVAMRFGPRLLRRNARVRRLADDVVSRLREQSTLDRLISSFEGDEPGLRRATAPDGTVTLLFSDIQGSSALTERLGDSRWLEVLGAHNALVRAEIARHGGFEVKAQGDGFMVAFPSARRAVACATAIQRAIDSYGHDPGAEPIHVRIGLHTGEAIRQDGDFFGKSVICAARIADQARGGEILVSSIVKELTEASGEIAFEQPREATLEGLTGAYELFPVRWRDGADVIALDQRVAGERHR